MAGISKKDEVRLLAEADFETFIRLVHPQRVLGSIHSEVCRWWTRQGRKSHQLLLLPRDHQKSALVAYRVAWSITRNPSIRVLYISSTSNLAIKQLKFIKDILTSDIYSFYWPNMVNVNEGQREKWTETEISVDHPKRKQDIVRDPTIFAAGLTTNVTGLHCDIAVLDDVVVRDNAYTEEGRQRTREQYSQLASIEGTTSEEWVVGTRYHPKDLYNDLLKMVVTEYNDSGEVISDEPMYERFERQVENRGDGTGEFIWPEQLNKSGKPFGFNQKILARKRAQYLDPVQFRAQYYNDPNDPEGAGVSADNFQYYDKKYLERSNGYWYLRQSRLNLVASIDFAFSLNKKADYTSIIVLGVNSKQEYYVLDIDRFKTDQISEYFDHILRLHRKWGFVKLRAEVTAGQTPIVESLKKDYIRVHNLSLAIDAYRPSRHEGTKDERITAILQPKYSNKQVWHYQGGLCQTLEEELLLSNPSHDDLKDALASAIDVAVPPSTMGNMANKIQSILSSRTTSQSRFGGI